MLCPKNSRCRKDSGGASVSHHSERSTKRSFLSMADFPGDFLRLTRRRKWRPGDNRDFWKKVRALALNQSGLHSQFCLLLAAWPCREIAQYPCQFPHQQEGEIEIPPSDMSAIPNWWNHCKSESWAKDATADGDCNKRLKWVAKTREKKVKLKKS